MAAPKGNKYAVGNNGGRPPKYKKPKDLQNKIIEYFDWIEGENHEESVSDAEGNIHNVVVWDRHPEPPTITGLALFLGFSSKDTLYNYAKDEVFSDSIKRALLVVEKEYEMRLGDKSPTGAIFALKNFGWKDKQEHDHTTGGKPFKGFGFLPESEE